MKGGHRDAAGRLALQTRRPALIVGSAAQSCFHRKRYPYEPRVIRGKLYMPAEHAGAADNVNDEMRAVPEALWPGLLNKLP